MQYKIVFTETAEKDIDDIFKYIVLNSSENIALKIYKEIQTTCYSLNRLANRGHIPPELQNKKKFGILEIHCKIYRIFYTIIESTVFIVSILDGRRNIHELLIERIERKRISN